MKQRNAFTLIELLVVIAIIAILAAILFPVFAAAREKARATTCISNGKQIALAFLQYAQDYDEIMPFGDYQPTPPCTGDATPYPNCHNALPAIYGDVSIGWPFIVQPYISVTNGTNGGRSYTSGSVFICPDVASLYSGSYASYTTWLDNSYSHGNYGVLAINDSNFGVNQNAMPLQKLTHPSTTLVLTECWYNLSNVIQTGKMPLPYGVPAGGPSTFQVSQLQRHNGGANCVMADGHVKWYTESYLMNDGGSDDIWAYNAL